MTPEELWLWMRPTIQEMISKSQETVPRELIEVLMETVGGVMRQEFNRRDEKIAQIETRISRDDEIHELKLKVVQLQSEAHRRDDELVQLVTKALRPYFD